MSFGEKIQDLRKEKNWSQSELGRKIGTSGSIIGRYERDDMTPSIDVVIKLANAFDVSIDYLVDEGGKLSAFKDANLIKRISEIESLPEPDKEHIYYLVDAIIRDTKTRVAYK